MKSIFNRLLASLVVFDNGFLFLTFLETYRRTFTSGNAVFNSLHAHALYPLRNVFLCCTIYCAIALALERYRAIRWVNIGE